MQEQFRPSVRILPAAVVKPVVYTLLVVFLELQTGDISTLASTETAGLIRSSRFEKMCGGFVPRDGQLTEIDLVAARSADACVHMCTFDTRCVSSKYDPSSSSCAFFQETEVNCTSDEPSPGDDTTYYVQVETTWCPNGGTLQDGRCLCDILHKGDFCQMKQDDCESLTCLNWGTCINLEGYGDLCVCPPYYTGVQCETVPGTTTLRSVMCESLLWELTAFPQDGLIVEVVVDDNLSTRVCREGDSYFSSGDTLWVDHGCRAIFNMTIVKPDDW